MDSHVAHLFGKSLRKEAVDTKKLDQSIQELLNSYSDAQREFMSVLDGLKKNGKLSKDLERNAWDIAGEIQGQISRGVNQMRRLIKRASEAS